MVGNYSFLHEDTKCVCLCVCVCKPLAQKMHIVEEYVCVYIDYTCVFACLYIRECCTSLHPLISSLIHHGFIVCTLPAY